ncbi:MAG: TrbI/VirB10 family protein [Arcobacteraceae bacterium]|jgi:type IV secretion system protein VirB10|nr:TrbI/VirB10 family protein [Arcobacteraceae bacterium]
MSKHLEVNNSPQSLIKGLGGKRLTKVPIAIFVAIILLVLFAIFYAGVARKQNQNRVHEDKVEQEQQTQSTSLNKDTSSFINDLENREKQRNRYYALNQEISNTEAPKTDEVDKSINNPTVIPTSSSFSSSKNRNIYDEKSEQIREDMKLKALISPSKIEVKQNQYSQSSSSSNSNINLNDLDDSSLEALAKATNSDYLQTSKQKPLSKYEIKAGWMIPATLITGINSDLAGEVLAQVNENIYDSATGNYLLIPQGTKLVGTYTNNVIYGQDRVLTAWTRLIFPNGDSLNLEGMGGTSADGYSGFSDLVNNHYLRIFGSAFLLSSITAGVALADNSGGEKETNADKAMTQAINQLSTVASEMIRKNMNIAPTIEIRPGYRFNIFVSKDMVLEPMSL